jgi:hypothetical protein
MFIDDDVLSNSYVTSEMLYFYDNTDLPTPCNPVDTTFSDACAGISPTPRSSGMCHRLWQPYIDLWYQPSLGVCTWKGTVNRNCESCAPNTNVGFGAVLLDGDSDATYVLLKITTEFYDPCDEASGGSTATHLTGVTTYRILKTSFSCTCGNCFEYVSNVITVPSLADTYCKPCHNWPLKITVGPAFTGNESRATCYTYGYGYNTGSGCPQCCDYCFDTTLPDIAFNGDCTRGADAAAFTITGATYNLGHRSRGRICRWSSEVLADSGGDGTTFTGGVRVGLWYNIHNPTYATLTIDVRDSIVGTVGHAEYTCSTFDCTTSNTFSPSTAYWCADTNPSNATFTGWPFTVTITTGAACVGGASAGCVKNCYYRAIGSVTPGEYEWELQESSDCECKCYPPSADPVAGDINVAGTCKSDHSAACSASTATWVWCVFDGANTVPPLPAGLSCGAGTGQTVSQWFLYSNCPTGCTVSSPAFDGTTHGEQTTVICF